MTPDQYTTTADPLVPMVCDYCGGHFVGDSKNRKLFHGEPVTICDPCLKSARDA